MTDIIDNLKELYDAELKKQEIKSNKRTIYGFLWILAVQTLVWALTLANFFLIDKVTISVTLGITVILMIPLLVIYRKGDLANEKLKYFLLLLVCIVSSVLVSALTFHAVLLCIMPLLFAVQYRKSRALWYTFGINTLMVLVSDYLGFYFGLCDLNILLESSHSYSWYMENIGQAGAQDVLLVPFNENPAFIIGVFEVIPVTLILFVFTVMLQYTITSNYEDALRIVELTHKKDMDILTNVFNNSKYQEMVKEYYPGKTHVGVAFWDINNLKDVNDRSGHSMGDLLITTFASQLNRHSGPRCRIYRIGGDEFLMVMDEPSMNELEQEVEQIKRELAEIRAKGGVEIFCAAGCAVGPGKDITEVVRFADERMYKDKSKWKEQRK